MIAAGTPAAAIAVDAGSYAISAVALARLIFPDAERGPARSLLRDLADGWAEFSAHSWLWLQTVQFTLFNLLTWGPYLVLGPVLARDYLGGARAWGAILASYGGGAIIGGLLALGRRPRRPLLVSTVTTLGFPLPPLAMALHLPVAAVAGGALLAGAGSALGGAISTTVTSSGCPRTCCPASARSPWSARSRSALSPSSPPARWRPRSVPAPCSASAPHGPSSGHSRSLPPHPSATSPGKTAHQFDRQPHARNESGPRGRILIP